jgi:hypothetical protein
MRRRQLDELAERVAALEAATGRAGGEGELESRLAAIEDAIRALRGDRDELTATDEAVGRCRDLVADQVPAGELLAVASASALSVATLGHAPSIPFGAPPSGKGSDPRFEDGAAAIAHLEALRARGARFLLLPEPARAWIERLPELTEHLHARYRVVADVLEVGLLFDLGSRGADDGAALSLSEELDRLADGDPYAPILAWTDLDVAPLVTGRNVFEPIAEDGRLPHLDRTVPIVVVDDPERLTEARRVSAGAVVRVAPRDSGGVEVVDVELVQPSQGGEVTDVTVIVRTGQADHPWLARVREAIGERAEVEVIASGEPWAAAADAEVAVVLDTGVLPLPGCVDALAGTLAATGEDAPAGAATGKVFDATGALAAAGDAVFADGSVAGIGAGSDSGAASWHEYVRPVWAASGALALRGSLAREISADGGSLLAASAAIWATGHPILYQPDAHAVLVTPPDSARAATGGAAADGWDRALPRCPERPLPLDETTWPAVVARHDPEDAWQ